MQRMLPVEAIDYTPPLGMMIVIDVSGSMSSGTDVGTVQKIDAAKNAAVSMVRDYTCLNRKGLLRGYDFERRLYRRRIAFCP